METKFDVGHFGGGSSHRCTHFFFALPPPTCISAFDSAHMWALTEVLSSYRPHFMETGKNSLNGSPFQATSEMGNGIDVQGLTNV